MNTPLPSLPRRDFFKASAASLAAVVTLGPSSISSSLQAAEPPAARNSIGIQVGAVSFVDEGTDKVLDLLRDRGAIDTIFADLNGDGRGDVLVGDSGGGTFTWWEQGPGADAQWTKHLIAKESGATNLKASDVNRDGVPDVVGSCGHGKGVFWFEGPAWKKHVIDPDLRDPHALAIGDFDGDGDLDVATAFFGAKLVRWYENDGKGSFAAHDIDTTNNQEAYDLKAVDLDADGRLDLILAGRETRNAVWHQIRFEIKFILDHEVIVVG